MNTRSSSSELEPLDLELEKTLRDKKKSKMAENNNEMRDMMRQMMTQMANLQVAHDAAAAKEAAEKAKVPLGHEYLPPTKNFTNGGWGTIVANNFELKPAYIAMIQQRQFGGRDTEDHNKHLSQFLEFSDTIKQAGVTTDAIRLRTFGFSLRDEATEWFESLDREQIPDWETMCKVFLAEYYPPAKAQKQVSEILSFSQFAEESFSDAWKRFLAMMRKCPQHGLTKSQQLIRFYNGLTPTARDKLDGAAGGSLLIRAEEDAQKVVETMAATGAQWPSERQVVKRLAAVTTEANINKAKKLMCVR